MANVKTVTLPELPDGQSYIPMPDVVTEYLGSGYGKWDMDLVALADKSPRTVHSIFGYGLRQIGNDAATGAEKAEGADKATDSAKQAAMLKRITAVEDGTHVFGHGGGARLTTYLVVLRENVSAMLVRDCREKKGAADTLARADCETAYMMVCESVADQINKDRTGDDRTDADAVFGVMWPKITAEAESEAKRRDAASTASATYAGIADMITAATIQESAAAKEPKARAAKLTKDGELVNADTGGRLSNSDFAEAAKKVAESA